MKNSYIWDQRGLPHKGWECVGVNDLEEPTHTCEMCGKEEIRHVFHMEHPEGHSVAVGCECAGHLTEEYERMRELNKQSQNSASKRRYNQNKLEKIKQQWASESWSYFSTNNGKIGIKSTKHIHAQWQRPEFGGWRYHYKIWIDNDEVLRGRSMFEAKAQDAIDNYIKTLSKL